MSRVSRRALPGFGLSLGYTVTYLSLLVLIPLAAVVVRAWSLGPAEFLDAAWTPRARAAYLLTFGTAGAAALVNVVLGLVVAWSLVRYEFPLKRIVDALVDVPLALPTAVAGLVYATLYAENGWIGQYLVPLGVEVAYTRLGIVVVLVFTGFPFVVRTVQPVLADLDAEAEEAAAVLGATRWETFRRVLLPTLIPPALTGFALALARGLGEYGSVVFISSNLPFRTEVAPMLIAARLEEGPASYPAAAAIAVVLLGISFALLVVVNLLERWTQRHAG
ncbi:MAG: sulfate ABC transporter permease subunit CysT [Gemmataceae bacterium]